MRLWQIISSFLFVVALACPVHNSVANDTWLESGLPPLMEPGKEPAFEITQVSIKPNHVDQEILTGEYRRTRVIPTLASEVRLVILPGNGGRFATFINPQITISPFPSSSLNGILDNLLDFRGEVPGGARVYLEMRAASPVTKHPPARISNVYWLGTQEQLAKAKGRGLAPNPGEDSKGALELTAVPASVPLPAGFPVRYLFGDRWIKATLLEPSAAGAPLKVVMFLARPGKLFLPWQIDADRKDARAETAAINELKSSPAYFDEASTQLRQRLARLDAPRILKPAAGKKLESGEQLVMPNMGLLDWAVVVSTPREGVVRVRSLFERREMDKPIGQLYLDPDPPATEEKPAASPPTETAATAKASTDTADGLTVVKADTSLKVGDRLKASWAGKYHDVEVLELLADNRVKIRWIGWGNNWDEAVARDKLWIAADRKPAAAANSTATTAQTPSPSASDSNDEFPLRTWTDNTGKSKVEGRFVSVSEDGSSVVLKRKDGRQITVPRVRLSAEDRAYVDSMVKSPFE